MTDSNPSTNDILARIRAQSAGAKPAQAATPPVAAENPSPPEQPQALPARPSAATPPAGPSKPAPTPGSTADILAAARARAGAAKAAAPAAKSAEQAEAGKSKAPAKKAAGSPADIMAAIRGGGVSAKAAPTEHTPDRPSPPAAAPAKTSASVPRPGMTAVDMIRAARQGDHASDGPTVPRVALPSKPLASAAKSGAANPYVTANAYAAEEPRRGFLMDCLTTLLSPLVVAWTSFTAAIVASTLATARFMMPNVLVEPPTRFKIGPPNDYAPGTVATKWQAQFGIWVVNAEVDGAAVIYALSTVCTHLGCTPNWLEGEQKFKCPCHGSGFYKSGINFEGPAPRPLERFGLRLAEDGMLEVDKSIKFQRELGQWSNPSCFVPVS